MIKHTEKALKPTLTAPSTKACGKITKRGQGTMTYENGNKYEGQWVNDKKEGEGTMTYADGAKYEGQWVNDKKEGEDGTMKYANGNEYRGQWLNDKKEGRAPWYADGPSTRANG